MLLAMKRTGGQEYRVTGQAQIGWKKLCLPMQSVKTEFPSQLTKDFQKLDDHINMNRYSTWQYRLPWPIRVISGIGEQDTKDIW